MKEPKQYTRLSVQNRNPHIDYENKIKYCKHCNRWLEWKLFSTYKKRRKNGKQAITMETFCKKCKNEKDKIRARKSKKDPEKKQRYIKSYRKYQSSKKGIKYRKEYRKKIKQKSIEKLTSLLKWHIGSACALSFKKCFSCNCYFVLRKGTVLCKGCDKKNIVKYNQWRRKYNEWFKICKVCDGNYLSVTKHESSIFCSSECKKISKKENNRIYRAKRRNEYGHSGSIQKRCKNADVYYEPVNRQKVFKRDKMKCVKCNIKVQVGMPYNDDAAEWDHIIPISKGGPHTYSNIQTLCRRCNIKKADKVIEGSQLTVFSIIKE